MIKTHQRGFTLIELVVVIVILGILAAFAVPRFMGLETEARISAVQTMGGTLRSAAAMSHGNCMAQNCPNASTQLTVNGQLITFVNQYPNVASIEALVEAGNGFIATNANGGRRFTKTGARVPVRCWVQYNLAAPGAAPQIRFPAAAGNGVQILGVAPATEQTIADALRANC